MLYRGLLHVAVVLGNRGLVLSRMHLRSDKGFETRVIESFELANSKKGYLTEFPRCKGRVVSTTYSYGCPKCIAIATNVYRKCQCQNPKCLIHKRNLVLQSPPTDISRNAYLSDATWFPLLTPLYILSKMLPLRTPLRSISRNRPKGLEISPYIRGQVIGKALEGIDPTSITKDLKLTRSTINYTLQ